MSTLGRIAKPLKLKGLAASYYKAMVSIGLVLSGVSGCVYWYYTGHKAKLEYSAFYENYNPDRDYIRMREAGVFRSVPPQGHFKMKIEE
ncbi:unnamed protein product [Gordionus sp. m RMFG-2023]